MNALARTRSERPTLRDEPAVNLYGDRLREGAMVGFYIVVEPVAEGGCGSVYRAQHAASGEVVAIKILHRQHATDSNMVKRFRREALAVQRIGHPGVVAIQDVGWLHDGRPYCIMEWIDGNDLATELSRRGRFSPAEILEVAEQIGAALDAAHCSGVVHRDVKAANVMIRRADDGQVRLTLLDFGIAKWAEPVGHATVTQGTLLGTPEAMAPEQIRGEPVDARTDVYAFGVLLFQLATGRLPFTGRDAAEIEEKHLQSPPPRASDLAPVPAGFDAIVQRCLCKQPADRYQEMPELLADLMAVLAPAPDLHRACVGVLVSGGEEADEVLDRAADLLRAAGMTIALDVSNAVLGVLAGDSEEDRHRAIACARELCQPGVSVSVHAGQVDGDRSGPLFHLGDWPTAEPDRIAVSGAAVTAERPADPRITWC
jgi:serine/threonine protein kinase